MDNNASVNTLIGVRKLLDRKIQWEHHVIECLDKNAEGVLMSKLGEIKDQEMLVAMNTLLDYRKSFAKIQALDDVKLVISELISEGVSEIEVCTVKTEIISGEV